MADEFDIPMPVYRVPRARRGMDAGTKRLMMIAGGLSATLLLVLGLSMVGGHHRGAVPVIEADSSPVRVKPDNPGGLAIAGQDDEVLSNAAGDDGGKLAPAAEAPALQALHAQERAEGTRAAALAAAAAAKPSAHAAQAGPAAAPVPPAATSVPPLTRSAQAATAQAAIAQPATAQPATAQPATGVPQAAAAAPGAHPVAVQLGALTTEELAKQEWARLEHKAPELLGGRHPEISRMERDGHALWRLRAGGFPNVAEATLFCERARAKKLPCSIAAF